MLVKTTTQLKAIERIDREKCIKILLDAGFSITMETAIKFEEKQNSMPYPVKNRSMLFMPMMKGNMKIDKTEAKIIYSLNINELLIKALIVFSMALLFFGLFLFENYLNLTLFSAALGLVVFSINWINLKSKVDDLTNEFLKAEL